MKKTSTCFINGLVLIVPLANTIFVIAEILSLTEGALGKHLPLYFPGLGILTILLLIYLVGWFSSNWFMKKLIVWGELIVNKIPVVKFIYNSVKHLSTAVFESNNMFNQVGLVPYSHEGVRAMGFVMADVPEALRERLGEEYLCVFIPWSLNMTSGTNLFVAKKDVIYLDISSESALQYILTAGAVMPRSPEVSASAGKKAGD